MEEKLNGRLHKLVFQNRSAGSITGIADVVSFDENTIVLSTACGGLEVQGEGLHIEKLSLDGGDLKVEGTINALIYEPQGRERGGLLSRLLGG